MKAKPARLPGQVVLEVGRKDEALLDSAGGHLTAESPFKIKNVLVPIDFSDCSLKALDYALPLAKQHQAELILLNIVATQAYTAGEFGGAAYASLEDELRSSAEEELASLKQQRVAKEASAKTIVQIGSPAIEIVRYAKSLPADLIVISTHGRTGLRHVVLGSVVEHVVQRAPCPVLVVRERQHEILTALEASTGGTN